MPRGQFGRMFICGKRLPAFKGRQAALDLFGIDAVGKAHIALDTEAVAGHQQQIKFPGFLTEGVGVLFQCLGEDIKGAARRSTSKPSAVSFSYNSSMLVW